MDQETLHVVFNTSAAATVRELFHGIGCRDRVVAPCGNLMYGPIDDIHGASRRAWLARHVDSGDDATGEDFATCWTAALASEALPVLWVARGDATESCGFLGLVSRIGDKPFDVIDVPLLKTSAGSTLLALGEMTVDRMLAADLIKRRRRMEREEIESDRALWRSLEADNAPLRLLRGARLVSAPLEELDEALLSGTTREWDICARVVGSAMVALRDQDIRICDSFLLGRVRALCASGALSMENGGGDVLRSSVRRP